ncbi:hypothetical protein RRG08_038589 [Elysia crispata]|uniref:glutathione gamma-glutamylcysteinyltransferase n=1 Tax=Elysia crispata TaxID=231223 RepID=A0AAE1ASR1_9GAST|nr:hypothetical protein RRG08_038589 [Elysia crispata]
MEKLIESNDQEDAIYFHRKPLPETCIDFSSSEGKQVFSEALASGYMECYFKLSSQFRTQDELNYCGLTSLVMALNALDVDPGRLWKAPWRWYHETMLDCCIPLETAQKEGVNMAQLYCLAKSNGLHPHAVNGKDLTLDRLRQEVKHVTKREDVVFIANYGRSMLGQTGDGHFSPIAGYHENRDLVLILDTARYKYPPHWVSLEALLDGMKDIDLNTGKPRGYIKLTVANDQTSPPPPPTLSELQMGSKMDDSLSQLLTKDPVLLRILLEIMEMKLQSSYN